MSFMINLLYGVLHISREIPLQSTTFIFRFMIQFGISQKVLITKNRPTFNITGFRSFIAISWDLGVSTELSRVIKHSLQWFYGICYT